MNTTLLQSLITSKNITNKNSNTTYTNIDVNIDFDFDVCHSCYSYCRY